MSKMFSKQPRSFVITSALLYLAILFSLPVAWPTTAECAHDQGPEAGSVSDPFLTLWKERIKLVQAENPDAAGSRIDNMVLERLKRGFSNLPIYSAALVKESRELTESNRKEQASILLAQAEDFAPDFYEPYLIQSQILLMDGRIYDAASMFIIGMKKKYGTFHTAFPAAFNFISVVMSAYYWLIPVFAVFLLVRYAKLVAHDLRERIAGFDRRTAMIMTAVLALFPAAFMPNEVLYAFVVILLLWMYTNLRERIIAAMLVALLFVLPFPFRFMGNGLTAMSEPAFKAVLQVREDTWGEKEVRVLSQTIQSGTASQGRENVQLALAKAMAYTGQFEKAVSLLEGFRSSSNEINAVASVMKGNIYYRWEKYPEALKWYENAAKLLPNEPIIHFNLATVLSRPEIVTVSADNVDRADKEMQRIKELGPGLVDTWIRYQGLDPGRFIVEMPIPMETIWRDLWTFSAGRDETARLIFRQFSEGISLKSLPLVAIGILIMMGILTFVETQIPHAHLCRMCGKSFCPVCQSEIKEKTICTRCYYAFETRAGLDPRVREQVRAEARSKRNRVVLVAEIMSLALPGSGHLFLGKSIRGIVFSSVTLLSIMALAYRHGVERSEWLIPLQSNILSIFLVAILYIAFVGFVVWNVSREE